MNPKEGWELLHSELPPKAIKEIPKSVYGVAGLSDVNEGFLIQRLFASELLWEWRIIKQEYLGFEDRTPQDKDYTVRYYLAAVHGELYIQGRGFHGSGASDNRRLDAAFKGAATVAFKNACKLAGLTIQLFKDGKAMDFIYEARQKSKAESVDEAVEKITETYGDPLQQAQQDERSELSGPPVLSSATTPAASSGEDSPLGLLGDRQEMPGANDQGTVSRTLAAPAPASPVVPDVDDRQPLYQLARTLRVPRTAVEVDAKIAKQGIGPVRMELVLAHNRDCGSTCRHVVELAGLMASVEKK